MATQVKTGTVKSVTHIKVSGEHKYSVIMEYSDPPPPVEVEHDPIDKEFYEDFKDAKVAGVPIKVTYDDGAGKPVSGTHIP